MDPHYLASLVAAPAGVFVGWVLRNLTDHTQQKRERVMRLFEAYYDPDRVASRLQAEKYLQRNAHECLTLAQLAKILPMDEWHDIATLRDFFAQLEMLRTQGKLDDELVCALFTPLVVFWFDPNHYFARFESTDEPTPHWNATRDGLRAWAIQRDIPLKRKKRKLAYSW